MFLESSVHNKNKMSTPCTSSPPTSPLLGGGVPRRRSPTTTTPLDLGSTRSGVRRTRGTRPLHGTRQRRRAPWRTGEGGRGGPSTRRRGRRTADVRGSHPGETLRHPDLGGGRRTRLGSPLETRTGSILDLSLPSLLPSSLILPRVGALDGSSIGHSGSSVVRWGGEGRVCRPVTGGFGGFDMESTPGGEVEVITAGNDVVGVGRPTVRAGQWDRVVRRLS